MDADIQNIIVLINQPDGFLLPSVVFNFFESVEPADAMINMCDIIAGLQVVKSPSW